jgi:hypothetical protein
MLRGEDPGQGRYGASARRPPRRVTLTTGILLEAQRRFGVYSHATRCTLRRHDLLPAPITGHFSVSVTFSRERVAARLREAAGCPEL